jgi:hypothetical protein
MKIIFLAYTSKTYNSCGIHIDRADLTRKMSCMETWVSKIESCGHEVIFFDGNNPETSFNKKTKTLHTTADESYDYDYLKDKNIGSLMLERLKAAVSWVINNREFDYIFRIDDGSYVNSYVLNEILKELKDCDVLIGTGGGAGMFLSKDVCEKLLLYKNERKIHIEDIALWDFFEAANIRKRHSSLLCHQYVLSENLFTIHYTNGKRQYTTDTIVSCYHNRIPIDRKVILNYNLDYLLPLRCNTWDSDWEITPLFYSFDKDIYNWEHYGHIARSNFPVTGHCPFAEQSIKELFFFETFFNFNSLNEKTVFTNYIKALKQDGIMYFYYKQHQLDEHILSLLKLEEATNYINIDIEHISKQEGNFYKLKKL